MPKATPLRGGRSEMRARVPRSSLWLGGAAWGVGLGSQVAEEGVVRSR